MGRAPLTGRASPYTPVVVWNIAGIVAGLALLVVGGELLVRGASRLALRLGLSPLVVGLTIVSIATSAPELAVTIDAVRQDAADLAVGNIVGSNISNIMLVLGAGALVTPLIVRRAIILRDLPIMVGFAVALLIVAPGGVSWVEGGVLLVAYVATLVYTVRVGRSEAADSSDLPDPAEAERPVWTSIAFVIGGVAALVGGAQLLVNGAVGIATSLGVSELVIGLTIVSIGTSLPELAATIVAVRRGETDMAVGNVVGSNIANIGLVLGLPALVSGGSIGVPTSAISFDIPLMIAASVTLVVLCYTDRCIRRWEGALMLGLYVAYVAHIVLATQWREGLQGFTFVLVWFVLPLVVLLVGLAVVRQVHRDLSRRAR